MVNSSLLLKSSAHCFVFCPVSLLYGYSELLSFYFSIFILYFIISWFQQHKKPLINPINPILAPHRLTEGGAPPTGDREHQHINNYVITLLQILGCCILHIVALALGCTDTHSDVMSILPSTHLRLLIGGGVAGAAGCDIQYYGA